MSRSQITRIGAHMSTLGGIYEAVPRAVAAGANTLQIFTASPRMWRAAPVPPLDCAKMRELRARHDCGPLVVHTGYLVNICSQSSEIRGKSVVAFHGEIERALAAGAEYLVLHPGSWRGLTRAEGLRLAAETIAAAVEGVDFNDSDFHILIENTAGSEFSLGGSFEQVAELVARLEPIAPVAACLDTCHSHAAGYDLVSREGYEDAVRLITRTIGVKQVRVWHMNDAKGARGSKLDRHQHIGQGAMGLEPFRRLLNDVRFAHAAFVAETPVDDAGDEARNIAVLHSLLA